MNKHTLPHPLGLADALFPEVELECGCGGKYAQEPHEIWTREEPVACIDCGAELSGNEFWLMVEVTRLKADVRYWKALAEGGDAPDLLEAAKAMDLDCRADNLNPCYAGRSTDVPGQHWGGGKACAPCTMRAAIAKAEGGDA